MPRTTQQRKRFRHLHSASQHTRVLPSVQVKRAAAQFLLGFLLCENCSFQRMAPKPGVSPSPGKWLEMQISSPHPGSLPSETQGEACNVRLKELAR